MPRSPENLVRHELIGLAAAVVGSTDPDREGLAGRVVDETRNTLVLAVDTENGEEQERVVPKDECVFRFTLDTGETVEIDGTLLVARPAERILKKFPRKWEYTDK